MPQPIPDFKAIDVIDRLPTELQSRLQADAYFCNIPVVVFDKGNVELEIQARQAALTSTMGQKGVAAIILPFTADDDQPEVAFGSLTLRVTIQVVEVVELNNGPQGTGKSARTIARKIRDVIKPLRLVGLCNDFVTEKNCITPLPLGKEYGALMRSYAVQFLTTEADPEPVTMCDMPLIAQTGTNPPLLQLTCTTPAAQIYYTLDDSYPSPLNQAAILYQAPFAITQSGFVRAAAYLGANIASSVNRAQLTVT